MTVNIIRSTLKRLLPQRASNAIRKYLDRRRVIRELLREPPPTVSTDALTSEQWTQRKARLANALGNSEWEQVSEKIRVHDLPELTGGVNPGDQRLLYELCRLVNAKRILEVGTLVGASTAHLALALAKNSAGGKDTKLVTVDITDVNDENLRVWEQFNAKRSPASMLKDLGVGEDVTFVTADSVEYLRTTEDRFDLVFLDGLHTAGQVYREIPLAINVLRKGGTVLLHDYFSHGRKLWKEEAVIEGPWLACRALQRAGLRFRVTPLGNLPWPTKRGGSLTSLAVITQ